MTVLFGGSAWPVGWSAGFVERPLDEVVEAARRFPSRHRRRDAHAGLETMLTGLLPPLEAPFTRRLLVRTRSDWTAYFDNSLLGGDPFSWTSHLRRALGCRAVTATHIPQGQYDYPTTVLELFSAEGEPPLNHLRTITAGIYDSGRWTFETTGPVQPFERPAAYEAPLVRDRFTRAMLVEYLAALGIHADDPDWFGEGVLFQEKARWERRTETLEAIRRDYATG